jgi:hypothetical protein
VTLLVSGAHSFSLAGGFLRSLAGWLRRHSSICFLTIINVAIASRPPIYSSNGVS